MKNSLAGKKKHPYISSDLNVSKGSPVISNTRVRVIDIVIEYDRLGLTPDQIIDAHPHLSLEAIHDALSYYYENRTAMDKDIRKRKEIIKKMAHNKPSVLRETVG